MTFSHFVKCEITLALVGKPMITLPVTADQLGERVGRWCRDPNAERLVRQRGHTVNPVMRVAIVICHVFRTVGQPRFVLYGGLTPP